MAESKHKLRGLRAKSFGVVQGEGEKRDWPEPRQLRDPFSQTRYKNWRLEPLPLGPNSLEQLADLLLESTDFATTVSQISADVTGLGYHFVPVKDGVEPPADLEKIKNFFDECNPDLSFDEICAMVNMDWEALGNGYIEVTRKGNDPKKIVERLDWVPGKEVRITKDGKNAVQIKGGKKVWFRWFGSDPAAESSRDPTRRPGAPGENPVLNELIWFKHPHPASSIYGVPRIIPALGAIRGNQFQQDRNLSFFLNKALPEWSLEVSGDLVGTGDEEDERELEKFRSNIQNHLEYMIKGQHYRLLYIERPPGIELKWHKLSDEHRDQDFPKYRKDNRDEALRAYGMQPNRVGVIESGNIGGGTGESQIEIYKNSIAKPRQEKWERKMWKLIRLGLFVLTYKMKFDELDAIDEEREAKILAMLAQTPYLKINEGRAYITKFLKMSLKPIDEPWADYPFLIIQAQLAMLNLGLTEGADVKSLLKADLPLLQLLFTSTDTEKAARAMYDRVRQAISEREGALSAD
jgi:capsid portal protein